MNVPVAIINIKKYFLSLVLFLFPVALYFLILIIPIPISISSFFSRYSFPYFIFVLFLYYVSFRVNSKYPWFFAACVTALIFSMRLSYLWHSGFSGNMIIGGLLPFRDGFSYYSSANFLFDGQLITDVAAWRPMFTSFVSSLLMLTQHNLMWSMAILVGFLGTSCYLSAYLVRKDLGALAGTLYITFLYFYIHSLIGFLYTEMLGLSLGCLGFILVWSAAKSLRLVDLMVGLAVLMVAVSVRAGTFFVFPLLVLWTGWVFRNQFRFSFRSALISFIVVLVVFLIVNSAFKLFIVEPGTQPFGNYAFTLYGQVKGGAGYNYVIRNLGIRDSSKIYRAAWNFFLQHPMSFFIGAAKAYRDFFFSKIGVFRYASSSGQIVWDYLIWMIGLFLTIVGLVKSVRKIFVPVCSLLVAVFVGFLFSIPFLPPIDGGLRIYASTMPFFFGLIAIGCGEFNAFQKVWEGEGNLLKLVEGLSIFGITLTFLVPIFIQRFSAAPVFDIPLCSIDQTPYVVELHQGSFIDVLPDDKLCGQAARICAKDFQNSSVEMLVDTSDAQVYRVLIDKGISTGSGVRIFEGNDLLSKKPYLFMGFVRDFPQALDHHLISGCGIEYAIEKRPSVFLIQTLEILE